MGVTFASILLDLEDQYANAVAMLYSNISLSQNFDDSDISGNLFTITSHGFPDGCVVRFTAGTGGLPGGLAENTDYVMSVVDANSFRMTAHVKDFDDGTFIVPTTASGTGHSVIAQNLDHNAPIEYAAALEVPNANGYARQTMTPPTLTVDTTSEQKVVFTASISVTFSSSGSAIPFSGIAVIRGGSTTHGSTTGQLHDPREGSDTVPAGGSKAFLWDGEGMRRLSTDTGVG